MKITTYCKSGFVRNLVLGVMASILMAPLGAFAASAPAPKISAAPASVNFPPVRVGGTISRPVVVKNTGTANLVVGLINFAGTDTGLFGQTNDCDSPVTPGSSCTVTVTFSPAAPFSKKSATMNIASNDPKKQTAVVKLSGQAPPPKVSASPMAVSFTAAALNVTSAARTVTILNTGISDLNISSVSITGTNASEFSMTDSWQSVLTQGESTTVDVAFTPGAPGTKSASLQILSDDPKKSTVNVKLSGKTSTTFSTADLTGNWAGSMVGTTSGTRWWGRFDFVISPDGSFTGTKFYSNGDNGATSGKFSMSSDGKITEPNNPKMLCTMGAGKTVFACTDTPDPGAAQLAVFSRKGASYEQADLEGTWHGNAVAAAPGANWWARMDINLVAGGAYTGNYSDSVGNTGPISGAFNITTDGVVTDVANHPNMFCTLDAGKTVVACTDTPVSGAAQAAVFTKQGDLFVLADLAGTWSGNSLATGPASPWWKRATFVVKPDGTYTSTKSFYDGSTKTSSGTLAIVEAGVIKFSESGNDVLCQVDSNKTIAACTKTWNVTDPGDPKYPLNGTTELQVITRNLK